MLFQLENSVVTTVFTAALSLTSRTRITVLQTAPATVTMPFMRGSMPMRRTIAYLNAGQIRLRDTIKILMLNAHMDEPLSKGTRWDEFEISNIY